MELSKVHELAENLNQNISKVIVGKEQVIENVIIALLAGGHILLEDVPGTGKTTLAKSLAKSIRCVCTRVQFTPDLLPSDLTGNNYFNQKKGDFEFRQGPLFTNILLADEINRATPRTQSSLLESMEEAQLTVDSETYPLEKPFFVIATQNPIETQGTFPLPEAQMDRFIMKLSVGYPSAGSEAEMLDRFELKNPIGELDAVAAKEDIIEAQDSIRSVSVGNDVKKYIVSLVEATREHQNVRLGVSPRGTIALMRASQVRAVLSGRDFVTPEDVKEVAVPVLSHRIICKQGSLLLGKESGEKVVEDVLAAVPVPIE